MVFAFANIFISAVVAQLIINYNLQAHQTTSLFIVKLLL